MSTVFCRQPSMNSPHVVESTTMKLKLVSPKPHNPTQPSCFPDWSLLQSPPHKPLDDYFNNEVNSCLYNQKSLKLSPQSLELCTESLGSESGSDMSDIDIDNVKHAMFSVTVSSLSVAKSRNDKMESKKVLSRSFPPPLMTMSGPKLYQFTPHREGGRLVIEAIETDYLGSSCLEVERSHGRLRLTCWKNEKSDLDIGSHENEMKELEKNEKVLQRVRRCNEDEKGDHKGICCNWEPCCWVAI